VVCSGTIWKGFGFVAFFASREASPVCIHLSCLVCLLSIVHGVCSHLFCGHKWCNLPEVSVTAFLPLQFFVFVRLLESSFLTHIQMMIIMMMVMMMIIIIIIIAVMILYSN
jgi:hypothetical protein